MSYSSHRKEASRSDADLAFRAAHARSCAVHVGTKHGVLRSAVLARVLRDTGVDLLNVRSGEEVDLALTSLDRLRIDGLGPAPRT